ncbi:MAG: Panacea domain-containing protein [bacterium]
MNPDERLRQLILYIAHKCLDDPHFGATKLNKILFWSDFTAYARTHRPITGAAYMKLPQGPAPRRLVPVRQQMVAAREIYLAPTPKFDKIQQRIVPAAGFNLSLFSAGDIAIVDEIIEAIKGKTGKELSALSHGLAWQVTPDGGNIAYQAAYLSDEPLSEADITRANELAAQRGWRED